MTKNMAYSKFGGLHS